MKIPELLAPAAGFACAEAAFTAGADSVYAGLGEHNLRAHAPSLDLDELIELLSFARSCDKHVYIVLNTMPCDEQMGDIIDLLKRLKASPGRPDAFIISDPGVLAVCREQLPDVSLHLSTQTGTFNSAAMTFWQGQGITRIILPRELSLNQIQKLATGTNCETEIFIHGAMCVSVSGRCLLGAYQAGRHPNLGDCPQPCRLQYHIKPMDDGRSSSGYYEAEENADGVFLLNSKDLNTLPILPRIIATGVTALKIEGRNKSIHYVSSVVKVYRSALDAFAAAPDLFMVKSEWVRELEQLDHRPYTTGFYDGEQVMQEVRKSKNDSTVRVVGVVREVLSDTRTVVEVKNPFVPGEPLDCLPSKPGIPAFELRIGTVADMRDVVLERAITNRLVIVTAGAVLSRGDLLRRIRH